MFSSSGAGYEDDLPDVPTTMAPPLTLADQQMRKMAALEEELSRMRRSSQCSSPTSEHDAQETPVADRPASESVAGALCPNTERLLSEVRAAVPFLSPQFSCSYHDCHLLLAAIRNGGAASSPGQLSVAEKLQSIEAENRGLQHKFQRQQANEQLLRDELAAARQSIQVTQENANRRTTLLSQRVEESRKQLLMEEGRSQRLKVKVKQLEAEVETLRDQLRTRLR